MSELREITEKLMQMWPHLNERSRRMEAAAEAVQLGYGGVTLVCRACGLSRVTITKGISELTGTPLSTERVRRKGGGRQRLEVHDPELPKLVEALA